MNALRAEQECRQLMVQYPNSKFAPEAEQLLRNIQEVLGESEMKVGDFYHHKGASPQPPTGWAEWWISIRFTAARMKRCGWKATPIRAWARASASRPATRTLDLVRDYPLSHFADQAKKRLKTLEMPIPAADPAAVARMKFETENQTQPGIFHRHRLPPPDPETGMAAKSGAPQMNPPKQSIPVTVPLPALAGGIHGGRDRGAGGWIPRRSRHNPDARQQPQPAKPKP